MKREKVLALSKFSKDSSNTSLTLSNPNFCTEEGQSQQGDCKSFGDVEVANLTWHSEEHVSAMVKLPREEDFELTTGHCGPKATDRCNMIQGPQPLMDAIEAKRFSSSSTFGDVVANQSGGRHLRSWDVCGKYCRKYYWSYSDYGCWGKCDSCEYRRRRLPMRYYATCEEPYCFPGAATVQLADGTQKQLSALRAGDFIQTFNAEGEIQYERLLGDFHGQNDKLESYLQLILQDGRTLEVSEGHLVFVADVASAPTSNRMQMRTIRAAALQPGVHMLLVAPDMAEASVRENSRFAPQKLLPQNLSTVRRVTRSGVYAPFTLSGQLIVDGVAASSYALLWPEPIIRKAEKSYPAVKRLIEEAHPIMHAITAPLRWWLALAALAPVHVRMETKRVGAELHWFARGGQALFETGVLLPFFPSLWTMVQRTKSTCVRKLP
jgi:hypothetical protein